MALRGKWEEAAVYYDRAIAVDPTYGAAAYEGRAAAYHALERHEEAARTLILVGPS